MRNSRATSFPWLPKFFNSTDDVHTRAEDPPDLEESDDFGRIKISQRKTTEPVIHRSGKSRKQVLPHGKEGEEDDGEDLRELDSPVFPAEKAISAANKHGRRSSFFRDSLYDQNKAEEHIFWESFFRKEEEKTHEKSASESLWQVLRAEVLTSLCCQEDNLRFWIFLLDRSLSVSIFVFAINIIALCFWFFMAAFYENKETTYGPRDPARWGMTAFAFTSWGVLHLVSLLFLVTFRLRKHPLVLSLWQGKFSRRQIANVWSVVPRVILLARFFSLVHALFLHWFQSEMDLDKKALQGCIAMKLVATPESLFSSIALLILFNVHQVSVAAFFPFPWPWLVLLSCIECTRNLLTMHTCSHLIPNDGSGAFKEELLIACSVAIVVHYTVNISLSAWVFEQSMRRAFRNNEQQHISAAAQAKFVNMLCDDVKLPAQKLLQTLRAVRSAVAEAHYREKRRYKESLRESSSSYPHTREHMYPHAQSSASLTLRKESHEAKALSATLNTLVNELLFLTKVGEARFVMHRRDRIHCAQMLRETLSLVATSLRLSANDTTRRLCVLERHDHTHTTTEADVQTETEKDARTIMCERNCVQALLHHSILTVIGALCEDDFDRLPSLLLRKTEKKKMPPHQEVEERNSDEERLEEKEEEDEDEEQEEHHNDTNHNAGVSMADDREEPLLSVSMRLVPTSHNSRVDEEEVEESFTLRVEVRPFSASLRVCSRGPMVVRADGVSESASLLCHKIASAAGGTWAMCGRVVWWEVPCGRPVVKRERMVSEYVDDSESGCSVESLSVSLSLSQSTSSKRVGEKKHATRSQTQTNTHALTHVETRAPTYSHHVVRSLRTFIRKEAMVYLPDSQYESIVLSLLSTLLHTQAPLGLPILRSVSVADARVHSIAFVSSISACRALSQRGFRGFIVFFSERLSYLDYSELSAFHFGVSLPCDDRDLEQLCSVLIERMEMSNGLNRIFSNNEKNNNNVRNNDKNNNNGGKENDQMYDQKKNMNNNSNNRLRVSCSPSNAFSTSHLFPSSTNHSPSRRPIATSSSPSHERAGATEQQHNSRRWLCLIPSSRRESFAKWRFFYTPLGFVLHHTLYLEVVSLAALLIFLVQIALRIAPISYFAIGFIVLVLFYMRRILFVQFVRCFKPSFSLWWYASGLVLLTGLAVTALVEAYRSETLPMPQENSSSTMMLGGRRGTVQSFFFLLTLPCLIRLHTELLPWPLSFIGMGVIFLRAIIALRFVVQDTLSNGQLGIAWNLLVLSSVCVVLRNYFYECCHAEGFTTVYDLLLAQDYLDRVLLCGRTHLTLPLKRLDRLHATILRKIQIRRDFSYSHSSLCDDERESEWESERRKDLEEHALLLKRNVIVARELLFYLRVEEPAFFRFPRWRFVSSMKAMLITRTVLETCAPFAIHRPSFVVNVFLRVHPALTLVRVDANLLSAMLSLVCRTAIERMERAESHSVRDLSGKKCVGERAQFHELLLWIRPRESAESTAFTDIRTMLVTVLESSTALKCTHSPHGETGGSENGKESLCLQCIQTSGHALSDRFMRRFELDAAFSTGLCHYAPHAGTHRGRSDAEEEACGEEDSLRIYQQFGVPFLLCPASYRLQRMMELLRIDTRIWCSDEYIDGYNTNNHIWGKKILVEERFKVAGIFCSDEDRAARARYLYSAQMFAPHKWICRMLHFAECLPKIHKLRVDVVLVDAEFKVVAPSTHTHLGEEGPLVFDTVDVIHALRACGYRGAIVVIHPQVKEKSFSARNNHPSERESTRKSALDFEQKYPYRDAVQADLQITLPLNTVKTLQIIETAMSHVV